MSNIIKNVTILGLSSLLSRILGLYRDHLFASKFGATENLGGIYNLDIYYSAFRLPDFIYQLIIMGTIATAFIPIFIGLSKLHLDDIKALKFTVNITQIMLFIMAFISIICCIFMPEIINIYVPGYNIADKTLTINITRILLLSPILFTLSGILQSLQNIKSKFYYFAMAPILYNLSIIIGTILYGETMGIYALAYAVVIGAFLHFSVQLPCLFYFKKWSYHFDLKQKEVRKFFILALPRVLGSATLQINLLIDTIIISFLAAGSLTVYTYAINIQSLPLGIIGISFSIATFGYFANIVKDNNMQKLSEEISKNIINIYYLLLPSIMGLFIVKKHLITLFLSGGAFNHNDILLTSNLLGILLIALFFQALIPIINKVFYAMENTKTPIYILIISVLINIILSLIFVFKYNLGITGVVLATAAASIINSILIIYKLNKIINIIKQFNYAKFSKIIIASLLMTLILFIFNIELKITSNILFITINTLLGILIYFSSLRALKY